MSSEAEKAAAFRFLLDKAAETFLKRLASAEQDIQIQVLALRAARLQREDPSD